MLFLDEIGDMPLALQARLLRALQAREVVPLGGGRPVPVDFALICATHHPLDPSAQDSVRADLYFRIAEYTVRLPALRERADRQAVAQALWEAGRRDDEPELALSGEVAEALARYEWPGNFRQLAAVLRTLRVLAGPEGAVRMDMLPAEIAAPRQAARKLEQAWTQGQPQPQGRDGPAPQGGLKALTDQAVREALAACGGNVSGAARRLGVHRSTLYRWARVRPCP